MMRRVYSSNACTTCKRRKKKCDERKPLCGACARLQLVCNYSPEKSGLTARVTGFFKIGSPIAVVRRLRPIVFKSPIEEFIINRVPKLVTDFFTPICQKTKRDMSLYWQLMFQDELAQSSLVACFSVIMGVTPEPGKLQRAAYGRALRQMRLRITNESKQLSDILPIETALFVLGFMDSAAHLPISDLTQHWIALLTLLRYCPLNLRKLSTSEKNLYLLIFETLAYHTTIAMFTNRVETLHQLFIQARISKTLEELNPRGSQLVENSPFLSGQYAIYDLILELTYLHRSSLHKEIETETLDQIDHTIEALKVEIEEDFYCSDDKENANEYRVFGQIYQVARGCLLICSTSLRQRCEANLDKVDQIASSHLAQLIAIPEIPMCWAAGIWPIIIVASALRDDVDFQNLKVHANKLLAFLPPGHKNRLEETLERLLKIRQRPLIEIDRSDEGRKEWPVGLSLLKKADIVW